MQIISNISSSHSQVFSQLLEEGATELLLVSPFLASDFNKLFTDLHSTNVAKGLRGQNGLTPVLFTLKLSNTSFFKFYW